MENYFCQLDSGVLLLTRETNVCGRLLHSNMLYLKHR